MAPKKRESDKRGTTARGRRVPIEELMAGPETVRPSEEYPFPRHRRRLPHDLEPAWIQWSRAMKDVDARTMQLLRAAFQAGFEARR